MSGKSGDGTTLARTPRASCDLTSIRRIRAEVEKGMSARGDRAKRRSLGASGPPSEPDGPKSTRGLTSGGGGSGVEARPMCNNDSQEGAGVPRPLLATQHVERRPPTAEAPDNPEELHGQPRLGSDDASPVEGARCSH